MWTYPESIRFLYGLQAAGMKFGLRGIRRLLRGLGHPENAYPSIHIAGSNGKGTTAALVASALTAAGYRTGLYSSPHLVDFAERIRVDGRAIPRREFLDILEGLRGEIVKGRSTFFEAATAIALEHFRRAKVDVAVLETGLGGRLDATNTVRPLVSVITSIQREHEQILGRGIVRIAREKGGIIKRGVPCVAGDLGPKAERVLRRIARQRSAPYVSIRRVRTQVLEESLRATRFLARTGGSYDGEYVLPFAGRHQVRNAAAALQVLTELGRRRRFVVSFDEASEGFRSCRRLSGLESRFEVLGGRPVVITDVAHNPAAVRSLVKTLEHLSLRRVTFVLGLMKDKDLRAIARSIGRVASHVVAVQPATERACESSAIARAVRAQGVRSSDGGAVATGVALARRRAPKGGIVVVTGSHFVVGEMLAARRGKNYLTINQ